MGARTVLIEADRMGGDCLNTGCVPSKALIAAARAAHAAEVANRFRKSAAARDLDFLKVHGYVQDAIARIATHD
jgi:pyruvate/2-oxoglutarate dehydrogenase complex dihydrolipoamide dehydrogenase (E3) component